MRETSCSDGTVKRAATRLKSRGDLVQESVDFPRKTVWRLSRATDRAARSPAYKHPGPTGPTGPTAVSTGDSGRSQLAPPQQSGQQPGASPPPTKKGPYVFSCSCADGGIDSEDGRCARCYGDRKSA